MFYFLNQRTKSRANQNINIIVQHLHIIREKPPKESELVALARSSKYNDVKSHYEIVCFVFYPLLCLRFGLLFLQHFRIYKRSFYSHMPSSIELCERLTLTLGASAHPGQPLPSLSAQEVLGCSWFKGTQNTINRSQ